MLKMFRAAALHNFGEHWGCKSRVEIDLTFSVSPGSSGHFSPGHIRDTDNFSKLRLVFYKVLLMQDVTSGCTILIVCH